VPTRAALGPKGTGGFQKLAHLPTHVTEVCLCAEDNGVGCGQLINVANAHIGYGLLSIYGAYFLEYFIGQGFRNAPHDCLGAIDLFYAYGNGHFMNIPIGGIIYDQYFYRMILLIIGL
jgi:hypothetical protein